MERRVALPRRAGAGVVGTGYDLSWVSTRRIGFLALGVIGVSLASTLLLLRRDSVEVLVQARADGIRAESDSDSAPGSVLERPEPLPRGGRVPASEDRPQSTEASGDRRPGEAVATAATYPVELRTLPESSQAEMKLKRDAIQLHLTRLTEPIFEQRFREGKFERLSRGKQRDSEQVEGQTSDISSTRVDKSSHLFAKVNRTTLPRSEYPDLYFLKDEVERLNRSIQQRALIELRTLPESSLAEMTRKRDAIQEHLSSTRVDKYPQFFANVDLTTLPRSEYADLYFLKDEVERLNRLIQERALADYYERKAAQAMEASR
jgi:hypothetical protein